MSSIDSIVAPPPTSSSSYLCAHAAWSSAMLGGASQVPRSSAHSSWFVSDLTIRPVSFLFIISPPIKRLVFRPLANTNVGLLGRPPSKTIESPPASLSAFLAPKLDAGRASTSLKLLHGAKGCPSPIWGQYALVISKRPASYQG